MLVSWIKSGQRQAGAGSEATSQWSPEPPGKATQELRLLMVLHGEEKLGLMGPRVGSAGGCGVALCC